MSLQVDVTQQSRGTSCGEAVIAMVYNNAYPQTPIGEQEVIEYAAAQGYYTEDFPPFTSPANMVKIADYYADDVSTGTVTTSGQGEALLMRKMRNSIDQNGDNAMIFHYNDPLTGTKETADWAGNRGVWNAWQTTRDPGGSGWWLVIAPPS